eukprot:3358254-Amphidinium_carterae.1
MQHRRWCCVEASLRGEIEVAFTRTNTHSCATEHLSFPSMLTHCGPPSNLAQYLRLPSNMRTPNLGHTSLTHNLKDAKRTDKLRVS